MSDRLSFLAKARPSAAGAYLTFLEESGKHLDDKTRFLISIVTKVVCDTPSGLKQYVPHAIRAGATGQEVIDAILMSFPAAGLTKVLNAIEVIQDMDLPELRLNNLAREKEWLPLIELSEIPDKKVIAKSVGGRDFIIYRLNEEDIKVYDRRCPHLGNRLPSKNNGNKLTCKVHDWSFDLETAFCIEKGKRELRPYKSKIVDNILHVKMIRLD